MKTFHDCIPCFIKQTLGIVKRLTHDEMMHEKVLRNVLRLASEMDLHDAPPLMGQKIHRLVREITGNPDPYKEEKAKYNEFAMSLVPKSVAKISGCSDAFVGFLRLAIAGNVIDFGKNANLSKEEVIKTIDGCLESEIDMQAANELKSIVDRAREILYLADNAGEIVFDRLFLSQLPCKRITYVVRGTPVINDVTMADAKQVGMDDVVQVIHNGSDAPGTVLSDCSREFQKRFEKADLIISKGQGNYETLSDVDKDIFFLLQVKCSVLARDIRCPVGSLVIKRKANMIPKNSEALVLQEGDGNAQP